MNKELLKGLRSEEGSSCVVGIDHQSGMYFAALHLERTIKDKVNDSSVYSNCRNIEPLKLYSSFFNCGLQPLALSKVGKLKDIGLEDQKGMAEGIWAIVYNIDGEKAAIDCAKKLCITYEMMAEESLI